MQRILPIHLFRRAPDHRGVFAAFAGTLERMLAKRTARPRVRRAGPGR